MRCGGDSENIADRHTTSNGGGVPLQSDNGRVHLFLSSGGSGLGGEVGPTDQHSYNSYIEY